MAKKHKRKAFRNARPATPRAPRPRRPDESEEDAEARERQDIRRQALHTGAAAVGTALAGGLLARWKLEPMVIAGGLSAGGTLLMLTAGDPKLRAWGAGAMGAAGGQLALQLMDQRAAQAQKGPVQVAVKKPANAGALPPGSVESAFERARLHMGISADEFGAAEVAEVGDEFGV